MKLKVIDYKLYSNKIDNLKISVIGDIHTLYKRKSFKKTIKELNDMKSDLLLVAGDITNTGREWDKKEYFEGIKDMLREFSKAHPTVVTLGNHDLFKMREEGLKNYDSLNEIDNLHMLNNSSVDISIDDKEVHIDGLVIDRDAYITKINDKKRRKNNTEGQIIDREMKKIISFKPLCHSKYNILLNHDPRFLRFDKVNDEIRRYDMITGAHMHNGYVPNFYTTKFGNLYDNDYFYFVDKSGTDRKGFCRGVIYGSKDELILLDQLGNYHYKKGDTYFDISEEVALDFIFRMGNAPIVINGGFNKYVGMPIDSQELTIANVRKI